MCHQIVHLNLSNIHIHEVSGLQKTFVNALTTLTGLYKGQGATTQPVNLFVNTSTGSFKSLLTPPLHVQKAFANTTLTGSKVC